MRSALRVSAALATLSVLALGACSAVGDEGESGGELSGTISFWHAYAADSPEVKTIDDVVIPAFNERYPDITVESVVVPYDELRQKLVTAAAGDQLPDLVRADIGWVPELADLGVLVPLSADMAGFDELAAGVYPGPLETNRWDGEYYGLPLSTNTRVMLYSEDILSSYGVSAPTTVDDLSALAAELSDDGVFVFADNGAGGWNILPWIWSAGGDITDADMTVASGYINSPASVRGVETLASLYQAGSIPDVILGDSGGLGPWEGLEQGQYATVFDGPWTFAYFASQYPEFDLTSALIPAGEGGSVSVVGGESVVMTASSENKEAAAAFLAHLLSEEVQLEMAKVGQFPVLTSLGDSLVEINPYYEDFAEQLQTARARPATPAWAQIDAVLQTEVWAAIRGEISVQEALDRVAEQADVLLAEYR